MSLKGQVCIVTGATSGIGAVTARELARLGALVVVVGRDQERCASTIQSIERETGNREVEFLQADLSSQAEVRRLAREFRARHSRLDVLVNNAGALFALRRESVDGIEMTFALNHLAPFLLTNLLLDMLEESAPARIINVASDAHRDVAAFDFEDPQAKSRSNGRRRYPESEGASLLYSLAMPWRHPGFVQYARSKLANLLFTYDLVARLEGTGVTANALHPGFVSTNFSAGNGTYGWLMRRWSRMFGIRTEEGAKTLVFLAASPEVAEITGGYFVKQRRVPSSPASQDRAAARRLWLLSEELTESRNRLPTK